VVLSRTAPALVAFLRCTALEAWRRRHACTRISSRSRLLPLRAIILRRRPLVRDINSGALSTIAPASAHTTSRRHLPLNSPAPHFNFLARATTLKRKDIDRKSGVKEERTISRSCSSKHALPAAARRYARRAPTPVIASLAASSHLAICSTGALALRLCCFHLISPYHILGQARHTHTRVHLPHNILPRHQRHCSLRSPAGIICRAPPPLTPPRGDVYGGVAGKGGSSVASSRDRYSTRDGAAR